MAYNEYLFNRVFFVAKIQFKARKLKTKDGHVLNVLLKTINEGRPCVIYVTFKDDMADVVSAKYQVNDIVAVKGQVYSDVQRETFTYRNYIIAYEIMLIEKSQPFKKVYDENTLLDLQELYLPVDELDESVDIVKEEE